MENENLDANSATLLSTVREYVLPRSTVFTDEYQCYDGLTHMAEGYLHRRINHSSKVYVMGDLHTAESSGNRRRRVRGCPSNLWYCKVKRRL
jgi:transposase-like protein